MAHLKTKDLFVPMERALGLVKEGLHLSYDPLTVCCISYEKLS